MASVPPPEDIKKLIQQWYILDSNAVPACMVLEDLKTMNDKSYWDEALPKLLDYLKGLVFDEEYPELLIGRSVTEWEAKAALINECDQICSRFFWLHREFKGGVPDTAAHHWDFYDGHGNASKAGHLAALKQWMREVIPPERIVDFSDVSFESFEKEDEAWQGQLGAWEKKVEEVLGGSLQEVVAQKQAWDEDGAGEQLNLLQLAALMKYRVGLTLCLQGWACLARRLRRCCTTPSGPPSRLVRGRC